MKKMWVCALLLALAMSAIRAGEEGGLCPLTLEQRLVLEDNVLQLWARGVRGVGPADAEQPSEGLYGIIDPDTGLDKAFLARVTLGLALSMTDAERAEYRDLDLIVPLARNSTNVFFGYRELDAIARAYTGWSLDQEAVDALGQEGVMPNGPGVIVDTLTSPLAELPKSVDGQEYAPMSLLHEWKADGTMHISTALNLYEPTNDCALEEKNSDFVDAVWQRLDDGGWRLQSLSFRPARVNFKRVD